MLTKRIRHWIKLMLSICILLSFMTINVNERSDPSIHAASKKVSKKHNFTYAFGVFNGVDHIVPAFSKYKTIVLDAQEFSKTEIMKLRKQGHIVYSYVNVGSWEKSRLSERQFYKKTIASYAGWPDERWMKVSDSGWIRYINQKTKTYRAKGIQGFFLDNFDVYDISHKPTIYSGLQSILKTMSKLKVPILINGGSTFVKQSLKEKKKYFTGVVQEEVFSLYTYHNKSYRKQTKANTIAYQSYLSYCQKKKVKVYIIEYVKNNKTLQSHIERYCKAHKITYYISRSINLN